MTDGARKDDAGKAPVVSGFLAYFPRAAAAVATVSQAGFEKYGEWGGWRRVPDGHKRYTDALVRHLLQETTDGLYDTAPGGTRCLHAAQVAWGALARLDKFLEENPDVPLRAPPEQEPVPVKEPEAGAVTWLGTVPAGATVTPEDVREMLLQHNRDGIAATLSRRLYGETFRPLPEKFDHACPDLDQEYPPCDCQKGQCVAEVTGSERVFVQTADPRGGFNITQRQCARLRARDDKRFDVV